MENGEIIKIEEAGMDIVYSQDKAQIDVQISTAKAYPRSVKRAIENSVAIVTMDKETASTCTYSVPRGGKAITGASVHLAKILAQNWGNLRIEAKVVAIEPKHVVSQAVCFDLENNIAIKVEVKRSIMTRLGRMNDDMITVTGNAGNSIALRNAVLSVIPRAVVDKVYKEAMGTITGDISDATKFLKRKKQVIQGLIDAYAVTEAEILSAIGKASVDHITADDLVVLIGIGTAIKDGDTTIDLAFRRSKDKQNELSDDAPLPKSEPPLPAKESKPKPVKEEIEEATVVPEEVVTPVDDSGATENAEAIKDMQINDAIFAIKKFDDLEKLKGFYQSQPAYVKEAKDFDSAIKEKQIEITISEIKAHTENLKLDEYFAKLPKFLQSNQLIINTVKGIKEENGTV